MSATISHFTTPQFWQLYSTLPREIQQLADKNFELLKADASHSSLRLKKVGKYWSARVGAHYRVLATERAEAWSGFGLALIR